MFSPKYSKFLLAVILAISTLVFLGMTLHVGGASAETSGATVLKSKILRKQNRLNAKLDPAEAVWLRSHAQEKEERKFEDEIPKHLPIKFKLKAEKEKKFKDLDNRHWYRDFELEVTNTSDKPIYYLELWLVYPEINSGNGSPVGVPLRYGRMNFIRHDTVPLPTDVPIQPGETHVFTIPEADQEGWEWHKTNEHTPDPKRVVLEFVHMSFGDGTGFGTSEAVPYPYRRQSRAAPLQPGATTIVAEAFDDRSFRNRALFQTTAASG